MNTMNAPSLTDAVAAEDEISLLDLLQTLVENLRLLIFGPLIAGLLALGVSFLIAPTFTATTQITERQLEGFSAKDLLQSRSIQDQLIKRFNLVERYEASLEQDARTALSFKSRISATKSGLITVSVDDKDPAFAAELANGYVSELSKLLENRPVTLAQQRRFYIEKQLTDVKEDLAKAQQVLHNSSASMRTLKAEMQAAATGLATVQARISAQEVMVASMRLDLAEDAPLFVQAQTELNTLRTELRQVEQSLALPDQGDMTLFAQFRDVKYNETLFELFSKHLELARVDERLDGPLIQVVDTAVPPERKSKPKKAMIAMLTTLATGFALLLFVFIRQAVRNASQDAESAAKLSRLRETWARALGRRTSQLP